MNPVQRTLAALRFVPYYGWQFLQANALVLREVVTPSLATSPSVVRVPARGGRPWKVGLFAQLISLMPGTLTLEVEDDLGALYVHNLHTESPEHVRAELAELERRLLEVVG